MARRPTTPDNRDERIRTLESDLYLARAAIIGLMPQQIRLLLTEGLVCNTFDDCADWERWAVDRIVALADKRPGHEMGDYPGSFRAMCPLCDGETSSPYSRGFSIPLGLLRHLEGSHGSGRCVVFDAAAKIARTQAIAERNGEPGIRYQSARVPAWKIPAPVPEPTAPGPKADVLPFRGKKSD